MATLQKIRNQGVLLIVVVGVALISFIVGDFLTQGSTFFSQSRANVAVINGEKIDIADYQDLLDQIIIFQKYETGQADIDEMTMQQIKAFLWDQTVRERLMQAEADKMGLTVTKEELSDRLIGNNIHPMIQQRRFFMDENGRFSRQLLVQFLNFKDEDSDDPQMQQALEEYRKLWIFLEKTVKFSLLQEKYNVLITNSVGTNAIEARANFDLNAFNVDADYVVVPYFTIPDSDINITDKEIRDRYNKQIKQYRQEPNVSINFVSFTIQPKDQDFEEAEEYINKLSAEFTSTDDVVELVNRYSDTPYTGRNYSANTVPFALKDFAFSGSKGEVAGPIFANNTYTMARIMETGIMLADSVKLRHIFLLSTEENKTDSLLRVIRGGGDFAALALEFSAVRQTAENGGEIGWVLDGDQGLDKEILEKAFSQRVNDVFTFKNAQGTQIIQIVERTAPKAKVKLAILERSVIASSKTESQIYNEAKRFAAGLKAERFDSVARQNNYMVRQANEVFQTNEQILNIPQSRQIVRWAFENNKGEVSDVFECGRELIVAVITDVNKTKTRALAKVSDQIRNEIARDKKAEVIINKIKAAGTNNIETLAAALDQEVKEAQNVNFGGFQFGVAGFEPAVIGKTVALKANEISAPIKGNAGVYVVAAKEIIPTGAEFDVNYEKSNIASRFTFAMTNAIMNDMRDQANVEDKRLRFY